MTVNWKMVNDKSVTQLPFEYILKQEVIFCDGVLKYNSITPAKPTTPPQAAGVGSPRHSPRSQGIKIPENKNFRDFGLLPAEINVCRQ